MIEVKKSLERKEKKQAGSKFLELKDKKVSQAGFWFTHTQL